MPVAAAIANQSYQNEPFDRCEVHMTEMDWNEELRKIEREFDGLPPDPSPAQLRALRVEEQRQERKNRDLAIAAGIWARLLLVAGLAGAMFAWPYARQCGAGLLGYLAAGSMIVIGGLWVVGGTWRHRMPRTHAVALLIVLWGLAFTAAQVAPRVGYAQSIGASASQWECAAR